MNTAGSSYKPPLALTVISSISIGIAGLFSLWILLDIIRRRGWESMMVIMIPVYVINALYIWPITVWTYLKNGRPPVPKHGESAPSHSAHHPPHGNAGGATEAAHATRGGRMSDSPSGSMKETHQHDGGAVGQHAGSHSDGGGHHHQGGDKRPMFATITVAVCHCGAGCVLGHIVGEWVVYGTGATINGRTLWPEFLIDFAFAIVFGVVFQYFSIAPMAGDYGPKTIYRAAKANILSLTFFEVRLFGWMAIFRIAIFDWKLEMNTVTYWWMMQIGMFLGHWTSFPMNWWLIKAKINESCA